MSTEEGELWGISDALSSCQGSVGATAEVMSTLGLSAGVFVPLFTLSSQK